MLETTIAAPAEGAVAFDEERTNGKNGNGQIRPQNGRHQTTQVKSFVLDTNVLLHDPGAILKFEDNDVIIPIYVIEEIDHFNRFETFLQAA